MVKKIIYTVLFAMVSLVVKGQEILSVDEAIHIALKNNYDILIALNDANIAKANNTMGNAGMLPNIQMGGSVIYNQNNINQVLSSGAENKYPSSNSNSYNANTQLSWTLFDGGKMFVTKNKLNEIEALGELKFKEQVLATMYNVIAAYYEIVRQKQSLNAINEVINYNRERVKIAQAGYHAGSLIKTDVLQAQIDLNVTLENAVNQQFYIDVAKKVLNKLLTQNADKEFEVNDSIPLNYIPDETELKQKLYTSNISVLSYQKQVDIAKLGYKEIQRLNFPKLNFNASYNYSKSTNNISSVFQNRAFGTQFGGSIEIPLFTAGENRRKISTSKIQLESAEYDLKYLKLQVNTDLLNALTSFKNQLQLLEIEKENNKLNKEYIEISLQRLKLGQSTSLELHLSQDSYAQSLTRLINIRYNLKLAEIKLKQLMASL